MPTEQIWISKVLVRISMFWFFFSIFVFSLSVIKHQYNFLWLSFISFKNRFILIVFLKVNKTLFYLLGIKTFTIKTIVKLK